MTDKVQKIRNEVERLKSQLLRGACSSQIAMETRCKEEAYNEVLALLDSLQEEPVSEDLEEAAKHYLYSNILYDDVYVGNPTDKDCIEMFKAGAKLGKNQAKAEIQAQSMAFAHGCPKEEPVSEDLEKAAEQYATEFVEPFELYYTKDEVRQFEAQHEDSFKAGAQWQKQQMMKDAIEAEIINWASMFTSIKVLEPERAEAMIKEKFNIGDKVKLIVIKED